MNKKKPGLVESMMEIVRGNIIPTKASPSIIPKNMSGLDLIKVGMSLASPSLIKVDVNMAGKQPETIIEQPIQPIIQEQPPQIINNYYNYYNYQQPIQPIEFAPSPIGIPESSKEGVVINLPDQSVKEVIEEKKVVKPVRELTELVHDIKKNQQQPTTTAAFRGFNPVPERLVDKSTVISPIPGINMDIVKKDNDALGSSLIKDIKEPDLSPEAVARDQQTMANIIHQFGYQQQYYPRQPQAQYPYSQQPYGYNQFIQQVQPPLSPQQPIIQDQNINIGIDIPKKEKPQPTRLPDNFTTTIPDVPKVQFESKFDNREMFVKFAELAHVQKIAEENDVHVRFSEVVFEDGNPNSGIVRVMTVNKENQFIPFKSFYIDFKHIIDNRIKVFPIIDAPLEGQQAYPFYYIPNKKERKEGMPNNKEINRKLFDDLFSAGNLMLNKSDGLYNDYKILSNQRCELITTPVRGLKSDERAKMIQLIQTMSIPNGLFDMALKLCPGSRWRFEATNGKGLTHRNFVLTNVNTPMNYGSIPRRVPECRIISMYRDKRHNIVVNVNGIRQLAYEVDKELNMTMIDPNASIPVPQQPQQ